jgi:hypothetical protein
MGKGIPLNGGSQDLAARRAEEEVTLPNPERSPGLADEHLRKLCLTVRTDRGEVLASPALDPAHSRLPFPHRGALIGNGQRPTNAPDLTGVRAYHFA